MRVECRNPVRVGDIVIGGPRPVVCLPLVAADRAGLTAQAAGLTALAPDLIEWRVDHFDEAHRPEAVMDALERLRAAVGPLPLLFTCRRRSEGGRQTVAPAVREALLHRAVASGRIDLADAELSNMPAMTDRLAAACRRAGVGLILSYHDFERTPPADRIAAVLAEARERGAVIAKIAVTAHCPKDVLALLDAACEARRGPMAIPVIAIAMGVAGAISRIIGPLFGSDVSFAVGTAASAPGQMPVADLRRAWEALGIR